MAKLSCIVLCISLEYVVSLSNQNFRNPFLKPFRHRRQIAIDSESCGGTLHVTASPGNLTSPGYPSLYLSNQDCQWTLEAPHPKNKILLNFLHFHLENVNDCLYDYLAVFSGSTTEDPLIGRFCGVVEQKTLLIESPVVLIQFRSDDSYEETGFVVEYRLEHAGNCNTSVSGRIGQITSPGYPNNYPDDSDCWITITAEAGKTVALNFEVLDFEYDESCSYDYVEVFDGTADGPMLLGKFCSSHNLTVVHSSTNQMHVHFRSDHLLNNRGFLARYLNSDMDTSISVKNVGGCAWVSDNEGGTITSPNFPNSYPGNSQCSIILYAPREHQVVLSIEALHLEWDENCTYDRLEIRDGSDRDSTRVWTFCGMMNIIPEVESTSGSLMITFTSDAFTENLGFKLTYTFQWTAVEDVTAIAPASPEHPNPLQFVQKPLDASVIPGDSHILRCMPDDTTSKISWSHNAVRLDGDGSLSSLEYQLLLNQTLLWIPSMGLPLTGLYTCTVATQDNVIAQSATISLAAPSNCTIFFRDKPKDTTLMVGDYVLLPCYVANHQDTVDWEKDGDTLQVEGRFQRLVNGYLFLSGAAQEDDGVYTCVAGRGNCRRRVSARVKVMPRLNISAVCGRPAIGRPAMEKPNIERGKIVGGGRASHGAHPWQVMLWTPQNKTFCGGVLLSERWVMTAAHCLSLLRVPQTDVRLRLGKNDQAVTEDQEVSTEIEEVIMHPAYDRDTFDNDLALVRLNLHLQFTDYIQPACLGDKALIESFFDQPLRLGTAIGWGSMTGGLLSSPSRFLKEIRLPIIDMPTCRQSTRFLVTDNMFCAGYAQEILGDACKGDSGGPFMLEHKERWYVAGIISWGEDCARSGKYGFYTRVSNFHSWIKSIIRS